MSAYSRKLKFVNFYKLYFPLTYVTNWYEILGGRIRLALERFFSKKCLINTFIKYVHYVCLS